MTNTPKLSPEIEAEIDRAMRRYERRERRERLATWNRVLGMYIDEVEYFSQ